MIELNATNEQDTREEAIKLSRQNPSRYIVVFSCFGLFASIKERLHTFEPSGSAFDWYVLNGKIRTFTDRQRIADQNATPDLF